MFFTCSTQLRFTMTLCEIWAAFTNLIVMVHVVAMEIATLKGCREAFVLLNGRKEWQNTCGRLARRMFDQILIYSVSWMFLKNETKLLRNWDLCFLSQEYVLFMYTARLSLPVNAAALDKFMKKQMAARGFLPAVCFIFSWKARLLHTSNTKVLFLCLSITLLSSLWGKERATAFVQEQRICFVIICTVTKRDYENTFPLRKVKDRFQGLC